jgi:uncharacterized protein YfaT (DUF1175 family)
VNQLELALSKKLNTHLDKQDELQDEVKEFFRNWFEKNLDPVALVNDPTAYLDEMSEKALAVFRKKYLPAVDKIGSSFGRDVFKKSKLELVK